MSLGAFLASLRSHGRAVEMRDWVARRLLRREPHVEFERMQQ